MKIRVSVPDTDFSAIYRYVDNVVKALETRISRLDSNKAVPPNNTKLAEHIQELSKVVNDHGQLLQAHENRLDNQWRDLTRSTNELSDRIRSLEG